jgi:hypothetical protein
MSTYEVAADTAQRVAIVIEKNKAETWSLGSYLIMSDGRRRRRGLGTFEDYADAAVALEKAWQRLSS